MRILLVDDEIELVSALAQRLNLRGIDTEWAASAKDAMVMVRKSCFHIAVLDIKMPEIDGIELMRQIQAVCPDTQFIFLSGHGSEKTYEEATESCSEASYLIKPTDIDTLLSKIDSHMKCLK